MHAIVVSRSTVHIALTIAALNALKVIAANIMNAILLSLTKKKYGLLVPNFVKTKANRQ